MAVTNIIERVVDIDAGVTQEDLHRLFAVADAQAHTFKITVMSKGQAQSLSGHTVVGYFMTRYHGTIVINGSISENVATLVLPAACYAHNDGFQLIIRLVSGSTKTAIYWGNGYVSRSASDPTIDPGSVVPNIDDLLAKIDQMEQATQAANTAATNANTAAEKSIRYDTAQSLTDAQKAQAKSNIGFSVDDTLTKQGEAADSKKVGDEISSLKKKTYTPIAYSLPNNTVTRAGITFTQKTDNTIVANGTATANAMYIPYANGDNFSFSLVGGKTYRLKGCPAGGGDNYRLDLRTAVSGGSVIGIDSGEGVIFTVETSGAYYPFIRIGNGTTVNNLTFTLEVSEVKTENVLDSLTVRFDIVQNKTEEEKARARRNLGIYDEGEQEQPFDAICAFRWLQGSVSSSGAMSTSSTNTFITRGTIRLLKGDVIRIDDSQFKFGLAQYSDYVPNNGTGSASKFVQMAKAINTSNFTITTDGWYIPIAQYTSGKSVTNDDRPIVDMGVVLVRHIESPVDLVDGATLPDSYWFPYSSSGYENDTIQGLNSYKTRIRSIPFPIKNGVSITVPSGYIFAVYSIPDGDTRSSVLRHIHPQEMNILI